MLSSSRRSQRCIVFLILATASRWSGAEAQSSSCTSVLISMSSCLNYITGNSSTPASSCCSSLANVVQSQPQCLCAVLNSGAASSLSVAINQTRALQLPNSCNVQTPSVSKCNGAGSGAATSAGTAPAGSPTSVPEKEPEAPSAEFPSGSGSQTVPESTSDGSVVKSSLHLMALVVSLVSCTSVLAII